MQLKILSLFPLIIGTKKKPFGSNGMNGPGFGFYWKNHPRAAAIAAHETFEARWALPFYLGSLIFGLTLCYFLLPDRPPIETLSWYGFTAMISPWLPLFFPQFQRAANFRGEAVEIMVKCFWYGDNEIEMIAKGASQLGNYPGAPSTQEARVALLKSHLNKAYMWMIKNEQFIRKVYYNASTTNSAAK
jgi:hypothetical protein